MVAKTTYSIKDSAWILPHNLDDKLIIFLDTFVWSKFVTNHNANYVKLRNLLERLVNEGKVHIAIYMGSIWEIGVRDDVTQFSEIITLMEKLSSGVFLKYFSLTFDDEFRGELSAKLEDKEVQRLSRNLVFGPFWEFAQNLSVEMPEWFDAFDNDKKTDFLKQLREKIYSVKLSDFPEIFRSAGSQFKDNIRLSLEKRYHKTIPDMSFKDILAEEQKAFGSTFVVNIAKGLVEIAQQSSFRENLSNLKKSDYVKCVYSCPTFYCYTHLQARLRFHKDKGAHLKPNHAYDVLHLGNAIPYVDWLLCDKEMATIIKETKLAERFNTQIYTEADIGKIILLLEEKFPVL